MTLNFDPDELSLIESGLGGRFAVDRRIESGGQGHVYRAERKETPQGDDAADLVAIKIFRPQGKEERVDREIDVLREIRHPGLAGIVEVGEFSIKSGSLLYIAYEYIEGSTLQNLIKGSSIHEYKILAIGKDIALAIAEIWSKRIVHRDVKPSNIMVRPRMTDAVLIDLAYARHLGKESITTYGKTYGTDGYMSPEQFLWAERELTCKSDVFSLAVALSEALAGRHPTGHNQQKLAKDPPDVAKLAGGASPGLTDLLNEMLSPRAAFRPSASKVATMLGELGRGREDI